MATTAPEPTHVDRAGEVQRLRAALAQAERERDEAREQQAATSEILRAIAQSPADVATALEAIVARAAALCDAPVAFCYLREGDRLRARAASLDGEIRRSSSISHWTEGARIEPGWLHGRALMERRTIVLRDLAGPEGDEFPVSKEIPLPLRRGWRAAMVVPLVRDGQGIGTIAVTRREPVPFSEDQVRLLQTFADQAVIAVENARLFSELQESSATLTQALERQTATAEVLRVIAGSPGDLASILGAIIGAAVRLCGAGSGSIFYEQGGGSMNVSYRHGVGLHRGVTYKPQPLAQRAGGAHSVRRAMSERRPVHHPDFAAEAPACGYHPEWVEYVLREGGGAQLVVPLLREDSAVGAIELDRPETGPFADHQIALLQTFADQAVIALENARLFTELQERDERRRVELERASAIQQRLLPSSVDGWHGVLEVAVRFRPAVETSGDFYDVLRLPAAAEGALPPLQIAVGDVAGKGMSAALVTALARSALASAAFLPSTSAFPSGTLRLAGQRLHRDVGSGHFVACALAVVEPPGLLNAGPLLRLSNAAQVPVLLVRDGAVGEIEPPGDRLPLGARPDGAYRDAEVELRPGDVVVFSSDGLVEAPAQAQATPGDHLVPPERAGELFGFERLQRSAAHWSARAESAESVAAGMWADLTSWCGEAGEGAPRRGGSAEGRPLGHHDDVTLLVLRVPAAA